MAVTRSGWQRWELGAGSWELGAGSWELGTRKMYPAMWELARLKLGKAGQ